MHGALGTSKMLMPAPATFRPIRRRRFGLFSTRNIVVALLTCLVLGLFYRYRVASLETQPDTLHDLNIEALDEASRLKELEEAAAKPEVNYVEKDDEESGSREASPVNTENKKQSKTRDAFVVASQRGEDTAWLEKFFPEFERWVYHVDDSAAELTVPKNKGRESMVYLTFIIDNYDRLPDNILFIHPTRFQWHNDDPDYDGLRMLRRFQLPYLWKEGYVNIRCAWALGCPAEIKPLEQEGHHRENVHAGDVYKKAFQELFPNKEVPETVAASCCAQFAATREKILENSKAVYEGYRDWLLKTDLEDAISGRVFEYSWHMILGKDPVHCPTARDCYCNVFGLCDLECKETGSCGHYILPPFSTLPKGWPDIGWEGEPRKASTTDY